MVVAMSDIVFVSLFAAMSGFIFWFAPKLDDDVDPWVPRTVLITCNALAFAAAWIIARAI